MVTLCALLGAAGALTGPVDRTWSPWVGAWVVDVPRLPEGFTARGLRELRLELAAGGQASWWHRRGRVVGGDQLGDEWSPYEANEARSLIWAMDSPQRPGPERWAKGKTWWHYPLQLDEPDARFALLTGGVLQSSSSGVTLVLVPYHLRGYMPVPVRKTTQSRAAWLRGEAPE